MERHIEQQIREAMAQGKFDNLPGKGQPLRIDTGEGIPAELRMGYTVLKNAGYLPVEAEWLKEIEDLRERAQRCTNEHERSALLKAIRERQLKVAMVLERSRSR